MRDAITTREDGNAGCFSASLVGLACVTGSHSLHTCIKQPSASHTPHHTARSCTLPCMQARERQQVMRRVSSHARRLFKKTGTQGTTRRSGIFCTPPRFRLYPSSLILSHSCVEHTRAKSEILRGAESAVETNNSPGGTKSGAGWPPASSTPQQRMYRDL